ncbi:hypothetical protein DHEL01_v208827 [Diaporthe helianthi]|uniref:Uncharacterized protein n=1 Tax=Diaporthe helianthi TaxID=158607 RepID=A0A2P5HR91_DIAHE|nr:hypothetical protein DHEL01_v208827 [Diaporthe helianthi]
MASRGSDHCSGSQKSYRLYNGDVEADWNDGLARAQALQAFQKHSGREENSVVYRQLKEIERVQRKVAPSDLSSEQEIHVHYVPVISNSPTNPFRLHRLSASLSNKHEIHKPKSQTDKNTDQNSTMLHTGRDERVPSPPPDRSHKRSPRRSKHGHEKKGKHGKKVDPYLEPLKQRWICYECGKIRSDKIRERHPLAVDQKMQPNWCGRCRITHECEGNPLAWYGQRHYCWGCGIVRSEKYHRENVLEPDQPSGPNYCRPCREASPSYEHNLREASEVGGETTGFQKAFMRQVHDAGLSDIEDDSDDYSSASSKRAPGKENDARQGILKSREATSSMLKNRSFKTKTSSDTSSDSNVTIEKLKGMHLEAEKRLNFGAKAGEGGPRLSAASSYRPPSVESASGCNSVVGGDVKSCHVSRFEVGHLARAGENGDCDMKDADFDTADKACQANISSTSRVPPTASQTTVSPLQVQQSDSGSRPTTCGTDDSGTSCGFHSGTSRTSAASMRFRARRNPAETSTGSPPERESLAIHENIGDKLRYRSLGSGAYAHYPVQYGAQELPPQGISGSAPQFSGIIGGFANARDQSGFPTPPTPPHESYWPHDQQHNLEPDGHMMNRRGWAAAISPPTAPMVYGRSTSQAQPDTSKAYYGDGNPSSSSGAEYGTKPGYFGHNGFNSAAHFSDAHCRRDFSGDSYYDNTNTTAQQYDYNKPSQQRSGSAQTQQNDHHVQQPPQYNSTSPYQSKAQDGFYDEPGTWPKYNVNGFSEQDPAFGDSSGESRPKDFDFSFIGQGKSGWAADTYVPTNEEINAYMERNFANARPEATSMPCTEPQWKIYEDEGDGTALGQQGSDARAGAYSWRDGKTSVHRLGSSTPGNTVTILSIREITSDEHLSAKTDNERGGGDDDGMFNGSF